ncbi:MAG: MFS transporter [Cyanobacteria bacterium P01_D01_bin.1]
MQKFILLCLSSLISSVGHGIAGFATTLWVWEQTDSATALVLAGFFYKLPVVVASLFAGIVVDRANRKHLLILSEVTSMVAALLVLTLYLSGHLAIWHLYAVSLARGGFDQFASLAYRASIGLMVAPSNYVRALSMTRGIGYLAGIVTPAIAGVLYPNLGLGGIIPISLAIVAFSTAILSLLKIPQPDKRIQPKSEPKNKPTLDAKTQGRASRMALLWSEVTFGLRYIWRSAGLRSLVVITTVFWAVCALGGAVFDPMILARSGGSAAVLGTIGTVWGIGGFGAAALLSLWGGFRSNVRGMLVGAVGAGLAGIAFGLGQGLSVWLPACFLMSIAFPLLSGSERALLTAAAPVPLQGRIFAARDLVNDTAEGGAMLLAGVLSDRLLEPAMKSPNLLQSLFAPVVGTSAGAGMALLYVGSAIAMLLVGIFGFRMPQLCDIEQKSIAN